MPTISVLADFLPTWTTSVQFWGLTPAQWLGLVALVVGAAVAGTCLEWLLVATARLLAHRPATQWIAKPTALLTGPARFFLALVLFYLFLPLLYLPPAAEHLVAGVVRGVLIVTVTWFALRVVTVGTDVFETLLTQRVTDPDRVRAIQTQLAVPRRIVHCGIVVLGTALVLLQFEVVRSVGVSLLASAGLAGLIIGLAAQRTIGNLLAGLQLALTQPIRIGDLVALENEWGWIEEIGLTYVVVKLWDLRRMVLPVSYFLEKPFQNWTRGPAELLGTVMLSVDYSVSIDGIRAELQRILAETSLWDRRAEGVQVTNVGERTVEVRVLVSARDGPQLWDLRCLVREKLINWLQAQRQVSGAGTAVAAQAGPGAAVTVLESDSRKSDAHRSG
jgi:small-conductance mechanosensitive channel